MSGSQVDVPRAQRHLNVLMLRAAEAQTLLSNGVIGGAEAALRKLEEEYVEVRTALGLEVFDDA